MAPPLLPGLHPPTCRCGWRWAEPIDDVTDGYRPLNAGASVAFLFCFVLFVFFFAFFSPRLFPRRLFGTQQDEASRWKRRFLSLSSRYIFFLLRFSFFFLPLVGACRATTTRKKRQAINKNESVVCIFDEGPVTVLDGQSLTAQKKMHIFF